MNSRSTAKIISAFLEHPSDDSISNLISVAKETELDDDSIIFWQMD
jgi:hypothetical protein